MERSLQALMYLSSKRSSIILFWGADSLAGSDGGVTGWEERGVLEEDMVRNVSVMELKTGSRG